MQNKEKITALLQSSISASDIARATGISRQYVSQLRNGRVNLDRISLGLAEKLIRFYDKKVGQ